VSGRISELDPGIPGERYLGQTRHEFRVLRERDRRAHEHRGGLHLPVFYLAFPHGLSSPGGPGTRLLYLPIDRLGANLFFQLISRRYERGPMILTSNQSFAAWGEIFGDRVIATAILDRLLHHAVTLNIRGNSYRLKEKLKAGLVRAEEATEG
jgi:hypothetical protein